LKKKEQFQTMWTLSFKVSLIIRVYKNRKINLTQSLIEWDKVALITGVESNMNQSTHITKVALIVGVESNINQPSHITKWYVLKGN